MDDGQFHSVMIACGYRYTLARKLPVETLLHSRDRRTGYYTKDYETEAGIFRIALYISSDPFTVLPTAFVYGKPEQFRGCLLPHLLLSGVLCYIEEMEADWNSNDLEGTYRAVDIQIQKTLANAVLAATKGVNERGELAGEFAVYWRPSQNLYILSNAGRGARLKTRVSHTAKPDGKVRLEYLTYEESSSEDSDKVIERWLFQRYLRPDSLKNYVINTHYVSVNPRRLAGVKWPPESFKDLLEWLEKTDHNARDRVVENIKSEGTKRYVFLFDVAGEDTFGIYVEFDAQFFNFKVRKNSSKHSTAKLAPMLGGKNACTVFKRLGVVHADLSTLLSRNTRRDGTENLTEKRIALIGCGTIGGYLAELLLRNGAGCGTGTLHLYDDDIYKPSNFGRHTLSSLDFSLYKSTSLMTRLKGSIYLETDIKGFETQFRINTESMLDYDIIIDATGRPPVSRRLASIVRKIPLENRPVIIHAFNDGNGRVAKVLIDDGRSCYGCMTSDPSRYRNGADSRFQDLDVSGEKIKSCGKTYTPYDAAVSNISASLAQIAVLSTLGKNLKWTYNEHLLDGGRSLRPQIMKRQPTCPICNARS